MAAETAAGQKSWCFDKVSMRISTDASASLALILSLSKGEGASPLSQNLHQP